MFRTIILTCVLASAAGAAIITVHNTGVNGTDTVQPIGSTTAFWSLAGQPAGAGYTLGSNPFRYYNGAYYADNSVSGWVSPGANGSAGATGNYTYQLTFNLAGLDPNSALISGTFGTDNSGAIWLNGNSPVSTTGSAAFGSPTNFTFNSGFLPGLNTISVRVNNEGDPTAFRVEFTNASANPLSAVPEPSSIVLGLSGLALVAIARLKR